MAALRLEQSGRVALLAPSHSAPERGVIPADWKNFDGILLRRTWLPKRSGSEALSGIEITWRSPAIDGEMALVLTDEQLYLQSGHDNPRPNHIYWLAAATAEQHAAVRDYLAQQLQKHAKQPFDCSGDMGVSVVHPLSCSTKAPAPERPEWNESRHLELTARSAAIVIGRLDKTLPKGVAPLPAPTRADLEMRVLVSEMADELVDWLH